MFCYQASALLFICNWSALLTIGVVNLIVPIAVYRKALSSAAASSDASVDSTQYTVHSDNLSVNFEVGASSVSPVSMDRSSCGFLRFRRKGVTKAVPDWLAHWFPGGPVGFANFMIVLVRII
eukprot:SAG31_NODE_5572_length_2450_cov_1.395151_3_plen_122_part_00